MFHCQQSLEKLLKAILIERSVAGIARRTHDLVSLTEELHIEMPAERTRFLRRLTELYVPTRYNDEEIDYEGTATEWVHQTEEFFAWLRQLLN